MSRRPRFLPTAVCALLCACPVLADHPKDMAKILPAAFAGDIGPANATFLKDAQSSGRNQLLYLYELGALNQLQGDFARSTQLFNQADAVAHDYEGKAVLSVTGGMGQFGAAMTNDTTLPWEGSCFDKVMSRTLNAMNYLALNKLEEAKVEVKKAEEYQSQERDRIRRQVGRAGQKDDTAMANQAISSQYNEMFSFTKDVRNSYENAFTYYLSSQIYRAQGSAGLNDALVDLRQALALAPTSPAIQKAYLELTAQSGDPSALEALKARFRVSPDWMPSDPAQTGTVIVIYEPGFAPRMTEVSIKILVGQGQGDLFSMAFPIYREFGSYHPPLNVIAGSAAQATTRIVDIRKLAVKALQERMPAILARATAGALGKIEAQKKAEQQGGWLGKMAAKVATSLVTNADLRSWLSLPAEIQAAQLSLPPGRNELNLQAADWTDQVNVTVTPGGTTIVVVRAAHGAKTITSTQIKAAL
jgi:hypothetical protein